MNNLLAFVVFILLIGCEGAFQPLPPEYINWQKEGASNLDVKKIILDCGGVSPSGISESDRSLNDIALVHICIEEAGFVSLNSFKGGQSENARASWCRNWPNLPACQLGAKIPVPSVERRLNSEYCYIRRDFESCIEVLGEVGTRECELRKNVPPECLP